MSRPFAFLTLLLIASAWGLSITLTKIAVSTGYQPFGLIFWQLAIVTAILLPIVRAEFRKIFRRENLSLFVVIASIGTLIPNSFSYRAAVELPAGVMAITIAMVPMFALPISVLLRLEHVEPRRIGGVLLGAVAVLLLTAPESSLPEPGKAIWVLVALLAPLCYGCEGNYLIFRGATGLSPAGIMFGSALVGILLITPLAAASGQFIVPPSSFGAPEWALVGASAMHIFAYTGYVWLVGRAGAVFASMVAYLVTGLGVIWSMLLLFERYSLWIWAAFGLMMLAIWLVQPRRQPA